MEDESKNIKNRILFPKKSKVKELFSCDICGKTALAYSYEKLPFSWFWIRDIDVTIQKACKTCIYKSRFGNKNYKQKMKESILDDKTEK